MAALAEDWVVDSLNEWLHSPMWLVPVLSFVDEHCLAFNGEEECPLACSQIHSEYVALLDALLEDFAGRMSLGSTQLLDAVQMGAVTQHAFEQVVMADDFQHFREVMFRRNLQLEREAIEELQRQHSTARSEASLPAATATATATATAASSSSSLESDSEMLERAVQLSLGGSRDTGEQADTRKRLKALRAAAAPVPIVGDREEARATAAEEEVQAAAGTSADAISAVDIAAQQEELQRIRDALAAKRRAAREKRLAEAAGTSPLQQPTSGSIERQELCVALARRLRTEIGEQH